VDEIYEYSYVTMYHRSELHTASYSKYETIFKGYYYYDYASNTYDDIVVLGCKSYENWGSTSTPWTNPPTPTWPTDAVYGLCMRGWIHTIEIWSDSTNWDSIFNADTETKTSLDTQVELFFHDSAATKRFKIGT